MGNDGYNDENDKEINNASEDNNDNLFSNDAKIISEEINITNAENSTGDFITFIVKLRERLAGRGYEYVQGFSSDEENVISTEIKYFAYMRRADSLFYFVSVFNESKIDTATKTEYIKTRDSALNEFIEKNNIPSIIVFDIHVFEKRDDAEEFIVLLDNCEEFLGQKLYTVNYAVALQSGTVTTAEGQPYDLDKMNVLIELSLDSNTNIAGNLETHENVVKRNVNEHKPVVKTEVLVYVIMLINTILLALMELNGGSENFAVLHMFGANDKTSVLYNHEYWRLFACMFLHIGFVHFVYNSLSLYIFGSRVERHYGRFTFLFIYLVSGVAGNVLRVFLSGPDVISAGASGAIYGLIGASMALTHFTKKTIGGLSTGVILVFIVFGVMYGLSSENIGNIEHITGLVVGYILGAIITLIRKNKDSREDIDYEEEKENENKEQIA